MARRGVDRDRGSARQSNLERERREEDTQVNKRGGIREQTSSLWKRMRGGGEGLSCNEARVVHKRKIPR